MRKVRSLTPRPTLAEARQELKARRRALRGVPGKPWRIVFERLLIAVMRQELNREH